MVSILIFNRPLRPDIDTAMESVKLVMYYQIPAAMALKAPNEDWILIETGETLIIPVSKKEIYFNLGSSRLNVPGEFITNNSNNYGKTEGKHKGFDETNIRSYAPILNINRFNGTVCIDGECTMLRGICPQTKKSMRDNGLPCSFFQRN
jgi:hypothetical protein